MDSLSKTYGMPGWRAGFMVGPEVVAKAVTIMNSNHITNIPEIVTAAAVAALSGPQDVPDAKRAEFQAKRDQVVAALNAIPGVVCPTPQGAFYAFPDISVAFGKSHNGKVIGNDVELCNALLEAKRVACVPGSAFGAPRGLRISYTCPTPQLAPGLQRIQEFFSVLACRPHGDGDADCEIVRNQACVPESTRFYVPVDYFGIPDLKEKQQTHDPQ